MTLKKEHTETTTMLGNLNLRKTAIYSGRGSVQPNTDLNYFREEVVPVINLNRDKLGR